ncbi:hypothetical protein LCGC14_2338460 [marine sediment metagenome]|uniref:Helicase C-terminal domain-containing protein n=1 Tax=marine sediment metagenome TaxID=412755 RepID=A0A0F9EQG4_9ZZZZ
MSTKELELEGLVFGRLLVLANVGHRSKTGTRMYPCLCECGKEKVIRVADLRNGKTRSCGCLKTVFHNDFYLSNLLIHKAPNMFPLPASNLNEQRNERRLTINERCEAAAGFANAHDSSVLWCHLNPEGDLLEKLTNDCVQVCGSQKDEQKEENLLAFLSGQAKRLVTKSKCAGLGLNMQHCAHMTFFPSHSYEQYYQSVRRCWRFGQKRPVTVDIITTEGEARVMSNLKQKADAADVMFTKLVGYMNDAQATERINEYTKKEIFPKWLAKTA